MAIEHHDLVSELPEYREQIHDLKVTNKHFAKLFEEYHDLTREVELMEAEVHPASTTTEEEMKKRRMSLKDELYAMIRAAG